MKRNHKYYVEMSLFAVSQRLSSREDTDAKFVHTLPPEYTLAQLHQELFQDLLLKLRSQAFLQKLFILFSFLSKCGVEGRSVCFYITTQYLGITSGLWEVEKALPWKEGSALPSTGSFHATICKNGNTGGLN